MLIHDYVCHEVLAHEDPQLVQVLLDIAVVERLDTGLAHALTGRTDAGDLLLRAEARGLFVSRLGPEGWFEVHALVRAALLGELARTSPERLAHQHVVAAQWFEDADEVALSLEHWLLANEARQALRLLAARHGDIYDTGREATLTRTLASIPVATATADVEAMVELCLVPPSCQPTTFRGTGRTDDMVDRALGRGRTSAPSGDGASIHRGDCQRAMGDRRSVGSSGPGGYGRVVEARSPGPLRLEHGCSRHCLVRGLGRQFRRGPSSRIGTKL